MKIKNQSISENIRSFREKMGYSQEYMSEKLNISQQTYSLVEKNPEKVNLGRIQEIAKILNVKISFLLNEEDNFSLCNINQQGGSTASYIQTVNNDQLNEKIFKQMSEEIIFLRNLIGNKSLNL